MIIIQYLLQVQEEQEEVQEEKPILVKKMIL